MRCIAFVFRLVLEQNLLGQNAELILCSSLSNMRETLPRGRRYFEYDVHPLRPDVSRGAERLVVDESKTLFYYTRDHYTTFTQIRLP